MRMLITFTLLQSSGLACQARPIATYELRYRAEASDPNRADRSAMLLPTNPPATLETTAARRRLARTVTRCHAKPPRCAVASSGPGDDAELAWGRRAPRWRFATPRRPAPLLPRLCASRRP